jgi:GTP-binding protein LepA
MLEITGTIRKTDKAQVLDRMDLEQERGITIKLTPVRMQRKGYEFNLIDTPGHVDFQYEVSRSLAAVEGALLLVDASQGIQAQTLSTLYQAVDQNIEIIPVLNKIDLPAANPERVAKEIEHVIGIDQSETFQVSGKTWQNVELVLDAIVERIKNPIQFKQDHPKKFGTNKDPQASRALIFDSVYDPYRGVVAYVKVDDGSIKAGDTVHLAHSEKSIIVTEVWHFSPEYSADPYLSAGQIWYIVTGQKSVREIKIGDTIIGNIPKPQNYGTLLQSSIPGFKTVKPYVYAWVYPIDTTEYDKLKDSLEKLSLNDSSIEYAMEDSKALWFGFRCGFLGMLHMDIVKERLFREYDMDTIFTIPTVVYLIKSRNPTIESIKSWANIPTLIKSWLHVHVLEKAGIKYEEYASLNEADLQDKYEDVLRLRLVIRSGSDMIEQGHIDEIYEPMADVEVVGPQEYAGNIMELCKDYRGELQSMDYLDASRVVRRYRMPMGELLIDFYDKLKSGTKWYGTMNYEFRWYESADLVKLDIFINNERIEALSWIIHKDKAFYRGRQICEKLKELIPKHMFVIPIQAGIGTKMIARETISAMRKDVIAKCYGWDVSRKRKLLQKQKEGKKKMKALGSVNVPSDVFVKMVQR